jgi:hypothetical protein
MKLYAYCLSDAITAAALEQAIGIADAKPYLIEREGVRAVVSEFDGDAVAVTRNNVIAHEKINASVLTQTTPLPFRFGVLTDAARLEQYLETHSQSLRAGLARVRDAVEMSVKVIWDKQAVESAAIEHHQAGSPVETVGPGTAFLAAKRLEMIGSGALNEQAASLAGWMGEYLGAAARESFVSTHPQQALVVRAAHLVERARLETYRERVKGMTAARREFHFLTSGPWPPYSFCDLNS